jgi:hypothetical protein
MPVVDDGEGLAELGPRGFLLSQAYDLSLRGNRIRGSLRSLAEPTTVSIGISRHPTFGRDIGLCGSWTGPVKLDHVSDVTVRPRVIGIKVCPVPEMRAWLIAGRSGIISTIPSSLAPTVNHIGTWL